MTLSRAQAKDSILSYYQHWIFDSQTLQLNNTIRKRLQNLILTLGSSQCWKVSSHLSIQPNILKKTPDKLRHH